MGESTLFYKERSAYWDNIKGILILLVVFAHVLFKFQGRSESVNAAVDFIYMFHMPAFVFVSGYFGKSERSRSPEKILGLIFLYFIFNSLMMFYKDPTSFLIPLYSYWYLIALIVWRLTAHRIAKFRVSTILLFALALIIGFFSAIDNHFAASRVIGFYPFYLLGYQLSEKKSKDLITTKYAKRALIGLGLLLCAAGVTFAVRQIFTYSDDDLVLLPYADIEGLYSRIALFFIAFVMIMAIRYLVPDKNIPLLTMIGRNSLWVFVLHRIFTLWISDLIVSYEVPMIFAVALFAAMGLSILFGNDFVAKYLNKFLSAGADIILAKDRKITVSKIVALLVALAFFVVAVFNAVDLMFKVEETTEEPDEDLLYPIMSDAQQEVFDNAFRITFAGDLILLEDQVKLGYTGDGYDFSDVFECAEPYISSADLAIGVFEGPMPGEDKGYSTSNYDDGKPVSLGFPDEFAVAVKDAGFDLVTTANNHLLDKGEEGALRTLDILDEIGLDHTGSYRNMDEKNQNRVKLVECQGIRIAVLSYTYGSNNTARTEFIDGQYSYMTSIIRGTSGEQFEKLKASVESDFAAAKALKPDIIMVLPHIGTQFSNDIDEEQSVWFEIFKENGADIILGDHPHVVEPVTIEQYNDRTVFTAYCPGNFANIYREHQGDTSMLIDVYIDRDSKDVIGGSIVPLYTYAPADGNYRAVPIYSIVTDPEIRSGLTADDLERASDANGIITKVVFGHKMDISSVTERYFFDENGFIRCRTNGIVLTEEMENGTLYQAMKRADSICFIGDSVTEGSKNGGCAWFEPLIEFFPDKKINNCSRGGACIEFLLRHADEMPASDLYVIAIGTNDVRYRDESMCAMTAESFIEAVNELKDKLVSKSPDAEFVFIAPWYSTEADPYCPLTFEEKTALNNEYSDALGKYCEENAFMYINANGYIKNALKVAPDRTYLLDHIHPNSTKGVIMYSEAVLLSGKG